MTLDEQFKTWATAVPSRTKTYFAGDEVGIAKAAFYAGAAAERQAMLAMVRGFVMRLDDLNTCCVEPMKELERRIRERQKTS